MLVEKLLFIQLMNVELNLHIMIKRKMNTILIKQKTYKKKSLIFLI